MSNFRDDEAVAFLTGGTQKTWYWAAGEPGHLGVGPNNSDATQNYFPVYYAAAPFEKAGSPDSSCLYDNELTFRKDGDNLYFRLDNGGSTFFHVSYQSVGGGSAGTDFCYPFTVPAEGTVGLSPSTSVVLQNNVAGQTRGTMLNFNNNAFMGYYIGQSSYEILSITENRMVVRAVMGNDPGLAWYHIFTTTPPVQDPVTDYTNLVWSDEFDVAGAPDATKWGYDLGGGGWGNNEVQSYTNNAANVAVSDGTLKINALKTGNNWTSARLKSQDKFEFTYGKVEARAKLPVGGGTWPAIWMLGANFPEVGWSNCGEIDIMEHRGNSPGVIHGSLHYPGNFGGNANTNTTNVANVSSEFHLYKVVWSPSSIRFYVDDVLFHSFANNNSVPFNSDFFLIMNVAMGGTFGGTVANDFQTATMEVDYIRVYQ
ncbi:glycoside hydrolase family 16 protein [Flavobacterium aurantiibacter]|uniref:glycoside hydrolase family 16 protein n=1 Tax=Flavobacterium aurantiibacter TaxID=2023067 RepID=UPI0026B2C41B|nr:glycoside hydrolase family 16 protein [Flavobacterium aurantiibacter]